MTKTTYKIRFTLATRYIDFVCDEETFKRALSELKDDAPFLYMCNIDDKLWIINKSKIELIEQVMTKGKDHDG